MNPPLHSSFTIKTDAPKTPATDLQKLWHLRNVAIWRQRQMERADG